MMALRLTGYLLLILWLTGCATVDDNRVDFGSALAQTTHEVTAATNALADAADAGLVSRDSDDYQAVKSALKTAHVYIELSWAYYVEGNLFEAQGARQAALAAYVPLRQYLLKLQEAQ